MYNSKDHLRIFFISAISILIAILLLNIFGVENNSSFRIVSIFVIPAFVRASQVSYFNGIITAITFVAVFYLFKFIFG